MTKPTLSVAMTTYNGAAYLDEQLDSIASQTRPPDELVISDDASTDDSVAMLERYAARVPFPVRVLRAGRNMGVVRNVESAVTECRGELIALADQDDRWYPTKLAVLEEALTRDARNQLAFTDADLIDADGRRLAGSLWEAVKFGSEDRRFVTGPDALFRLLASHFVTGATLAFRTELRDLAFPVPEIGHELTHDGRPFHLHDGWLAIVAATRGRVVPIAARSLAYRLHEAQHTGVPPIEMPAVPWSGPPRWRRRPDLHPGTKARKRRVPIGTGWAGLDTRHPSGARGANRRLRRIGARCSPGCQGSTPTVRLTGTPPQ
jgi:hypothetical protein